LPDITNKLVFIEFAGMFPIPFIPSVGPVAGLAPGIGMFIFCSGDACGLGEADGICMAGMFICVCGDVEGDACGICMAGMFICVCGDVEGVACGICMPGMFICICDGEDCDGADFLGADAGLALLFIPGMLAIPGFLVARVFLRGFLFFLGAVFARDFGFCLLIPGMFAILSWAGTSMPANKKNVAISSDAAFMRHAKFDV
jgi:hypothetical protein